MHNKTVKFRVCTIRWSGSSKYFRVCTIRWSGSSKYAESVCHESCVIKIEIHLMEAE